MGTLGLVVFIDKVHLEVLPGDSWDLGVVDLVILNNEEIDELSQEIEAGVR